MKVKVKYIPCLFDESTWIEFESRNQTVLAIFASLFQKHPEVREDPAAISIRVNGKKMSPLEWEKPLNDGDEIFIIQEIGGEWILGALATIWSVLSYTIPYIGITVWQAALIVASVAYTIYSYCATPEAPKTGQGLNNSPTYGWDGLQMQIRQGIPVAVVYGEHLVGGNVIEAYISSVDDKNYLNILIALSEGEIEGIMKEDLSGVCTSTSDKPYVLLNDNLLSNFTEMTWDYRKGTQDQTQIAGFGDICQVYSLGAPKMTSTPYVYTTVDSDVEALDLRFRIPGCYIQWRGNYYPRTVTALIEHKLHSEPTTWINDGSFTVTKSSQDAIRRNFRIDSLTPGQYDIRVTLTEGGTSANGPGDLYLDNITEIKYDTLSYPHTALIAIKILATEKISGSFPNVLTRMRGIKTLNLDTSVTEWTKDPIYNVNDLIVKPRYGAGRYISQSNMNNDQLILMSDHCNNIIGNGVKHAGNSATATSLTDSDYTFVAGDIGKYLCCKSPSDTTIYTVMLVTSLTGDHTANGSGGWSAGTPADFNWEYGEKRYELDIVIDSENPAFQCINQICGSFRCVPIWNKDAIQLLIDKKESPVYIFNMGNIIDGSFKHTFASEKAKPNWIQVDYADRDKKFQKETVDVPDFPAIIGGTPARTRRLSLIGASRRSQIYREGRFHLYAPKYQDEQVGFKGTIDAIHMLPGDPVLFQHDVFQWGLGGRIVSATTTSVTLDQSVTIEAGKAYAITCKLTNDTLETKTVTDGAGTYTTVHISGAFTTAPPAFGLYAFGETNLETKPFRIMQVSKTPENEIEVMAIEYSENVYADTDIILAQPFYSPLPPDSQFPTGPDVGNPFSASMTMDNLVAQKGIRSIVLSWDATIDPNFFIVEVWRSATNNRASATKVGESTGNTFTDADVVAGNTYFYWVRAKSIFDGTIVGTFEPAGATSGVEIKADWAATLDVKGYAITRGAQYYNAAGFTLTDQLEHEIGTITVVTNEAGDSVWIWASIDITQLYKAAGGKTGDISPIQFRVRRDSTTGTVIAAALTTGYVYAVDYPAPVVLIGTDVPGGSAGNHIYKLTAQQNFGVPVQNGIVAYRKLMGLAKSR